MPESSNRETGISARPSYVGYLWRHDRSLRWVLPLLALGALGVVGLLPRLWTVARTPAGRGLRISGLDWLQSRSLGQSAQRLETAGDYSAALVSWQNAAANNPGNANFVHGMMRCLDRLPEVARDRMPDTADWLVHLSATNRETLRWLAPMLARHGNWRWLGSRLTGETVASEDGLGALRSRAQFESADLGAFDAELAQFPRRLQADPELALISVGRRALLLAGRPEADRLQHELEAALAAPATRSLALRLLMDLAYSRRDLWHYEQLLAAGRHEDSSGLASRVRHWRLLRWAGQAERAATLARESGSLPGDVQEAESLLQVLAELGLKDTTELVSQQALARWGNAPSLWVAVGEALISLEDWDGLRDHAVRLRQIVQFPPELRGYSWFLEGLAEHRQGRLARARAGWAEFRRELPVSVGLVLRAAGVLDRSGLPEDALAVLAQLRERGQPDDAVLVDLQRIAYHSRNLEWFSRASRELYERHPGDYRIISNHAAALIIHGERFAEALPLTLLALQLMPESGTTLVNHAVALIQAGRAGEAAPLLSRAQSQSMDPSSQGMIGFAKVCYFCATGRPDEGRRQAELIKADDLFPSQVQQLEAMLRPKVAARPGPDPSPNW